jgi:hypothetical protein
MQRDPLSTDSDRGFRPWLVTNSFKEIYDLSSGWPTWVRHLLLGLLVAVEERWIAAKAVQTVDKAIEEVEPFLPPSGVSPPVYSESGDGFFDEMRLTAPWKVQESPSDSPQV